jgi:hypothetical protein
MHKYESFQPEGSDNIYRLLVLDPDSKYPFKMGKKKCKLIMENIQAVMAFSEGREVTEDAVAALADDPFETPDDELNEIFRRK